MEKLLYSIPKDKWDDFVAGSAAIQKIWLKEHLLLDSTDFFSALVLSKVQSLPVTRKDVKAIVGNQLPEALAKVLRSTEICDLEPIKMFNKLVIREVASKIQSSTNQDSMKKQSQVRRSMDKLFHAVDQVRVLGHQTAVDNGTKAKICKQENVPSTNAAPHTLRAPRRKAKGAPAIYNKYHGGKQWLKEGVPKLPTIPEATQMEEMLAEINHFGYNIQTYNEVWAKMTDQETTVQSQCEQFPHLYQRSC
ncbi:uncharacterized protein LOC124872743 isoform X1 [Girardinichthys multiradiatus]|uniref:uncharacterized protein LOC124872743 isoform X1 n=1 Tax=Girardinichthys multiradiatus TaxID=208333 RepID=UPI001FAB9771|nr:uncharacterized protein LOC124872743 isoform X1 [Girardinichthys multiradiatus]